MNPCLMKVRALALDSPHLVVTDPCVQCHLRSSLLREFLFFAIAIFPMARLSLYPQD